MRRAFSVFFALFFVMFSVVAAYADTPDARAVIGADLTDEQIYSVYSMFGISPGSVKQMTMTNAIERSYLENYVDSSIIGTRSISCVYVELTGEGSGSYITTSNVTWCTPEMYLSALSTAGISDVRVVVAAPVEVSGTAALAGIYMAYEDLTGTKLTESAKLVSTQQLAVTGDLAKEIGSIDAESIVGDLKSALDYTKENMTDDQLKEEIKQISSRYNVKISDKQLDQLVSLFRSLEGLDEEDLLKKVQDAKNTLNKVSEAREKVVGFAQSAQKIFSSVQNFFNIIINLVSK